MDDNSQVVMGRTKGEWRSKFDRMADDLIPKRSAERYRKKVGTRDENLHRAETAKDEILRDRQVTFGRRTETCIFVCASCHQTLSGVWAKCVRGVPVPTMCPKCGKNAVDSLSSTSTVTVKPDWSPYFDTYFDENVKGATYVEGKGTLILSRKHACEVARLNGVKIRPGL